MVAARTSDDARRRKAIVAAGRRLGARGLISAGEGNLSVRLGDALLITPSGRRKDELAPGDLVVMPLREGREAVARGARLRPSSDLAIHRAVYAARPDVLAVVHAHLPAAMALTLAGEVPDPAALPETALLLPRVPFVPFAAAGSDELAAAIAAALAEPPEPLPGAALLERHGAVAVGATADPIAALDQAVDRLELLEVLCRTWRDALTVRAAVIRGSGQIMLRSPSPRPGSPARGRSRRQP
jgi:ribulose-5-phosphate 4-epimerase/fuculose-1-phosphate aldolase